MSRHKWYSAIGVGAALVLLTGGIVTMLAHHHPAAAHDLAQNCGLVKCNAALPSAHGSGPVTRRSASPSASPSGRRASHHPASPSASPRASARTSRHASPTADPPPYPDVTVSYRLSSQHGASGQFEGTLTITNHGTSPVGGWTITLGLPKDTIISVGYHGPNGHPFETWHVSQGSLILTATTSSERLPPHGSQQVIIEAHGSTTAPTACLFNGSPCQA